MPAEMKGGDAAFILEIPEGFEEAVGREVPAFDKLDQLIGREGFQRFSDAI